MILAKSRGGTNGDEYDWGENPDHIPPGEDRDDILRQRRESVWRRVAKLRAKVIAKMGPMDSEEAVDGVDMRSDSEKSDDADRVAQAAMQHPPVASEPLSGWLTRVYREQLPNLTQDELDIARRIFQRLQGVASVNKRATGLVEDIVTKRAAIDKSKSWHQHYRDIMNESPGLYQGLRDTEF